MEAMIIDYILNSDDDDSDDNDSNDGLRSPRLRRPRIFRPRRNWFNLFDETDFYARYRLPKRRLQQLLNVIEPEIVHNTDKNNAVPPMIQLLVAVHFLATGSFYVTMADFCGISKTTAHNIIHRVSRAIARLRRYFIVFPSTPAEIRQVQRENFQTAGFIRVIGAVDCVHIKVQSYGGDDAELYRNRKSFFSINVQVITNSRLQILDIVARWPGSTHDATIFDFSEIKARFEDGEFGNALLVGDSGYPNLPYLMTPLNNPLTAAETLYNESQIRTRSTIERCFGIWGRKFAVLNIGSRCHNVQSTFPMIIASAVLYNIYRLDDVPSTINPQIYDVIVQNQNNLPLHVDERQYMIDNYFQRYLINNV